MVLLCVENLSATIGLCKVIFKTRKMLLRYTHNMKCMGKTNTSDDVHTDAGEKN